jgi:hypothetical protein
MTILRGAAPHGQRFVRLTKREAGASVRSNRVGKPLLIARLKG